MYGHCLNPQPKGPHLARRRRYDHYLTCIGCHGRHSVLARDVRCCRCIDLGCAGCARAQARPGGRGRARGGLRSGRRSFARYDAAGGNVYILNQPMRCHFPLPRQPSSIFSRQSSTNPKNSFPCSTSSRSASTPPLEQTRRWSTALRRRCAS